MSSGEGNVETGTKLDGVGLSFIALATGDAAGVFSDVKAIGKPNYEQYGEGHYYRSERGMASC